MVKYCRKKKRFFFYPEDEKGIDSISVYTNKHNAQSILKKKRVKTSKTGLTKSKFELIEKLKYLPKAVAQ